MKPSNAWMFLAVASTYLSAAFGFGVGGSVGLALGIVYGVFAAFCVLGSYVSEGKDWNNARSKTRS